MKGLITIVALVLPAVLGGCSGPWNDPYPIEDAGKKKALTDFLAWMLTTGQKDCEGLAYAPLPTAVVAKEKKQIALIR